MATVTLNYSRFDVVEYIKKLRNANFTQDQAETIAQETEHMLDAVIEQTKYSIASQELATRGDLEKVKLELQREIIQIEARLIKWVVGVGLSGVILLSGVLFTTLKLMLH